jgi:CheY-like chemotaxis protein
VWSAPLASLAPSKPHAGSIFIPRVMLVDDSEQMVALLSMWLEDEGCEIFTALTGREALDVAATYYPDIVFLDVVLPPPDGLQVCKALKHRLMPEIILMTGVTNPDVPERAAALGIATLLRKPFTQEAAIEAYNSALDRCRRDPLSRLREHFGSVPRIR